MADIYDIVIIGGGPAGLGAALYGARGLHPTLIVEKEAPGGLLRYAATVDDYPGMPNGIGGAELGKAMWDQCTKFGAETVTAEATAIETDGDLKVVKTTAGDFRTKTVIIACGGTPRRLGVPGEDRLRGKGVYDFAASDFAALEGKPVIVVGGGDTAFTHALRLAEVAAKVTILHRGGELRAFEVFQEAVEANAKIELYPYAVVEEILGEDTVTGVRIRNSGSSETGELQAAGVFVDIGFDPATGRFAAGLERLPSGHIVVDEWMATTLPGVFAAGDVRTDTSQQAVAAAGDGATAAIAADHYLTGGGHD